MKKDFDNWNISKQQIHTNSDGPLFHEREIWFCSLGVNIGFEQDGTGSKYDRPILIMKGFNTHTFFCAALVGRKKEAWPYFYIGTVTGRDASVNLSQVRTLDTKRLIKKIGMLDKETYEKVKGNLQKRLFT